MSSYWSDVPMPEFPALDRDVEAEVIVVGGGFTGIMAAYLLKRSGRSVVLLERDRCASQDTAHTTAHLTCVTDLRLHQLVERLGEDHAGAVWDAGHSALDQIEEIVSTESIACDFSRVPGYLHAALAGGAGEEENLRNDAALANTIGFDAEFLPTVPVVRRAGVRYPNQAVFHPLKFLAKLVLKIPGNGSLLFERSEATDFERDGERIRITANQHNVTGNFVVIATDVPLMGLDNAVHATLVQTKIAPYTSYAVGAQLPKGIAPQASFWDTSDPYYFLRITHAADHDYAIFGGMDHKTGQAEDQAARYDALTRLLSQILPEAKVDRRWSGQVIESHDGLPLIGVTAKNQFIATGYSGNGLTFGTVAANMACDLLTGRRNPWAELFDPMRSALLRGPWDYLRENMDYPYYLIRDRLRATDRESLDTLKPGKGEIRLVNGKRTAAYRGIDGKLTLLSPVCTHLGCIVRWNEVDSTWDCPCHGSRFRNTGEVLAGPAETPLTELRISGKGLE